ncbi:large conductance mechanosensitive channel protein MscL [Micromonospora sp. NPDC003197]
MLKGFKDFIMRGNVVDLAVGVVIGAAFTTVVTQLTNSFLKPLITVIVLLITGKKNGIEGAAPKILDVPFDWIAFVNAVITFLLTAAALYFLVVFPMNKLAERRKRGEEPPPAAPSEEVKLLTEIRDALVAAGRVPAQPQPPAQSRSDRSDPDTPYDWNAPRTGR